MPRRKATLEKFLNKIAVPNPRPKKPRVAIRAPKFKAGDCLSIRMENGQYAAGLVLVADHSRVEYGQNLIAMLDYLSPEKPQIDVFLVGFSSVKDRIEVAGVVDILPSDPKSSRSYCGWALLGRHVIYQREWNGKSI